jgi:hypothetical protein
MASATGPVPPHVTAFNARVAELIKTAQPNEIADLISHPGSLLRTAADDNQNQNQGGKSEE